MKTLFLFILSIVLVLTFSCKKDSSEPKIIPTGISLTKENISLLVGGIDTLKASILTTNATNQDVLWTSTNSSIATVSSSGIVVGKASGIDTITVLTVEGSIKSFCIVSVVAVPIGPTGVSIPSSVTLTIGGKDTLKATILPVNATNQTVSWISSNTAVATVSSTGIVTAISAGSATITATTAVGNKTATCALTVTAPSTGFLPNEIPVDSLGVFNMTLVPTTNKHILYEKNIANYFNYNKTTINLRNPNCIDTIRNYKCNYFVINSSDTLFNQYAFGFPANNLQTSGQFVDNSYVLSDFYKINQSGQPMYKGILTTVRDTRNYTVVKDVITISQAASNTSIIYKILCIDKDENYLKVLVNGQYEVKFTLVRSKVASLADFYNIFTVLRNEKWFLSLCVTTKDFSGKVLTEMSY